MGYNVDNNFIITNWQGSDCENIAAGTVLIIFTLSQIHVHIHKDLFRSLCVRDNTETHGQLKSHL